MNAGFAGMEKYVQSCKSDFWKEIFRAESDYILHFLKGSKDILSIGCGPAIIETCLAEHGFKITGLDVSKEALDQAPDNIRTVAGTAENMDFPDTSFDAAIYIVSLQFIEKYEEAVKEAARVLKPAGKLLVMLLNPHSEFFKEKFKSQDSYIKRIKHINIKEIEKTVAEYFCIETEYFLGIKEAKVFQSRDSNIASLYVIKGTKL